LATKASTLSNGGGNGSAMTFNWSGQGGQPTWLWGGNDGSNMYVWNPSNFSVNYANSAGSATTASTVSNSAITAAKLDGNQSGSAPIYGVRAWSVFAGSTAGVTSQFGGNVTIARVNVGRYTATFDALTPMPNANYCVVGTANNDTAASNDSGMIIAVRSKTTTSFIMDITDPTSNTYFDPKDANIMVIG
jgi:hypothetical protein